MKKIVCAHLLNDYSGSPKVLAQIIDIFSKNDYSIDLYLGHASKGFLSKANANILFYPYQRNNNKLITFLYFFLSQLNLFFKLLKYRKKDVVIYVNTMLPFGAAIMGKLTGKLVIYHIHETSIRPKLFKKFLRMIIKLTASKIIYVSEYLKLNQGFNDKNQLILYNSLNKSFLIKALENNYTHRDKKGNFNIFLIASLKIYKGILEFIAIAKKCSANKKLKFILILNANTTDINYFFKNIEISQNLRILPSQEDLHKYYKSASLVLNLSRVDQWVETFGLTIIEAMAYGIPVIVPPIGGPAEIVEDNVDGFLISSYEIEKISKKIIHLFNNKSLCIKLSERAKLKANNFDESIFHKKILSILND